MSARGPTTAAVVNPVFASGSVFAVFFSSTTLLRATSSARVLYSRRVHGVAVPEMLLYGTRAAGSNSPRRKRTRRFAREAASMSASVIMPPEYAVITAGRASAWSWRISPVPPLMIAAIAAGRLA